jgi:hypothetical protein
MELAEQNTHDTLALACHLIEFAAESAPKDTLVLQAYNHIYNQRAKHSSITSSMARKLFTAAAKSRSHHLATLNNPSDSWWNMARQGVKAFVGIAEPASSPLIMARTVPLSALNYTLLDLHSSDPIPEQYHALTVDKKQMLFVCKQRSRAHPHTHSSARACVLTSARSRLVGLDCRA